MCLIIRTACFTLRTAASYRMGYLLVGLTHLWSYPFLFA